MYKATTVELLLSTRFYDPSLLQCAGLHLRCQATRFSKLQVDLWIYLLKTSINVHSKNSRTSFIDSFFWSVAWHFRLSLFCGNLEPWHLEWHRLETSNKHFSRAFVMWVATRHVRVTLTSSSFCSSKRAFLQNVSFSCVLTVVELVENFG